MEPSTSVSLRREAAVDRHHRTVGEARLGAAQENHRRSDFFRDLAGAAYMAGAERVAERDGVPFERVLALYDRAILNVETRLMPHTFADLLRRAAARVRAARSTGDAAVPGAYWSW